VSTNFAKTLIGLEHWKRELREFNVAVLRHK